MLNIMAGILDFQGQKQNLNHPINNMDWFFLLVLLWNLTCEVAVPCTETEQELFSSQRDLGAVLGSIQYQKGQMCTRVISSFIIFFFSICDHAR